MVKNSNFRKIFLPVDSVDSGDSESLGYKNFHNFGKIFHDPLNKTRFFHNQGLLIRNDMNHIL